MAKHILKKTEKKVAVKIAGAGVTETISLDEDLLKDNEELSEIQKANIVSLAWTGAADATATITRGGTVINILQANAARKIEFVDTEYTDSVENDKDLVVTTTGDMQVYIVLRKQSGYLSKIDDGLSIYDDPDVAGS